MAESTLYRRRRVVTPAWMTQAAWGLLIIWRIKTEMVNIFPGIDRSIVIIIIINVTLPAKITEIFSSTPNCPGQDAPVYLSSYQIGIG